MLILVFAFIVAKLTFCVLVVILSRHPDAPSAANLAILRPICYGLAAVGILGAVYWATSKLSTSPNIQRFQTDMILCLALSEVACIAGLLLFFLERQVATFWPFAIASVVTDLIFVLPRVLQRP